MIDLKPVQKDKVVIVGQKEVEKKVKHIGSIRPNKGHTLFEFDRNAMVIRKAKFERDEVVSFEKEANPKKLGTSHKRVIIKEGCFYLSALNHKNAIKKLIKLGKLIQKK